jgi:hypothetical protein
VAKKVTKAEQERRITQVYTMLLRREPRHAIVQYGSNEWGVTPRATDNYIAAATACIVQEQEELRATRGKMFFHKTMSSLDFVFRQAVRDRDWRTCLAVIKEQNTIMGIYPSKMQVLEAIQKMVEENIVPGETLQEISASLNQFQESAIGSLKKIRQQPESEE